ETAEGGLDCASCAPSGAAATSDVFPAPYGSSLSEDGRVFFTSADPLVLRDANGKADAYEFSNGEAQLISTGRSPEPSHLLTASADGANVFFFTHQTLVPTD